MWVTLYKCRTANLEKHKQLRSNGRLSARNSRQLSVFITSYNEFQIRLNDNRCEPKCDLTSWLLLSLSCTSTTSSKLRHHAHTWRSHFSFQSAPKWLGEHTDVLSYRTSICANESQRVPGHDIDKTIHSIPLSSHRCLHYDHYSTTGQSTNVFRRTTRQYNYVRTNCNQIFSYVNHHFCTTVVQVTYFVLVRSFFQASRPSEKKVPVESTYR